MLPLMRRGTGSVWALLLLACSTHDASLGESHQPPPSPIPTPPLTLTCESRGGSCISPQTGACSDGTWVEASCQDSQQHCCVPSTPPPLSACEQQSDARCYPLGTMCNHPLMGFDCADGFFCCEQLLGQGSGGHPVGMGPPAGAGG